MLNLHWLTDAAEKADKAAHTTVLQIDTRGVLVRAWSKPDYFPQGALTISEIVGYPDLDGARFNPILPAIDRVNRAIDEGLKRPATEEPTE